MTPSSNEAEREIELSIVMPCLDEAKTVRTCVEKALRTMEELGVAGEVIVADNGSTDGSQDIARDAGARVVDVTERGYGAALRGGIEAAHGTYVIMGDADDSYDFTGLSPFIEKLREGYDLVMGNRFKGGIKPGAMPPLHRFFGNPLITAIGRVFFRAHVGDFYCGLRGFRKDAVQKMDVCTSGMEFALEMVVRAHLLKMKIIEVPTTLDPDGRDRAPHLRSWRDGWRSLRFFLIFSPRWLFLIPGLLMLIAGAASTVMLINQPRLNSMLFSMMLIMMGIQCESFYLIIRNFATQEGFLPPHPLLTKFNRIFELETGLIIGGISFLLGLAGYTAAFCQWAMKDFGPLSTSVTMHLTIPSSFLCIVGIQIMLTSFILSIISLEHVRPQKKVAPADDKNAP